MFVLLWNREDALSGLSDQWSGHRIAEMLLLQGCGTGQVPYVWGHVAFEMFALLGSG